MILYDKILYDIKYHKISEVKRIFPEYSALHSTPFQAVTFLPVLTKECKCDECEYRVRWAVWLY